MQMSIVERARRLMGTCEPAIEGQGGSTATFRVACALVWGFGLSPEEAMPLMLEYNQMCSPPWPERDLWHKLRSVLASSRHTLPRGHFLTSGPVDKSSLEVYVPTKKKEKVTFDLEALKKAQRPEWVVDAAFLRARSPVDPRTVTAGALLDGLYGPEAKLMVFGSMSSRGDWMRWRGGWYELGKTPDQKARRVKTIPERTREGMIWLIQPVDGQWHAVAGKAELSRRTQKSVVAFPYLLLESDEAPADLWLNMVAQLPLPIHAIVTSGGRSVHALLRVGCETVEQWRECVGAARDTLAALGCDSQALSNPMVNMRMPNVLREGKMAGKWADGKRVLDARGRGVSEFRPYPGGPQKQQLLYFNPYDRRAQPIGEGTVYEHEGG